MLFTPAVAKITAQISFGGFSVAARRPMQLKYHPVEVPGTSKFRNDFPSHMDLIPYINPKHWYKTGD